MEMARMVKILICLILVSQSLFLCLANAATTLNASAMAQQKLSFHFGADVESFVNKPSDFSRWTNRSSEDSKQFKSVLESLGKPTLRFASLQRWDWRGEKETLALVTSPEYQRLRKKNGLVGVQTAINYNYVSATQYYDFCKLNGISTIPMLDVQFFYDSVAGIVKETPANISIAAKQYAAGYANFIKKNGYHIPFWEIGNEEYLTRYQYSPEDYARVARAYIDAVLQVNPNAKFGVQLYLFDFHPEWRVWSEKVLDYLKSYNKHIDYACLHYYGDGIFSDALTGAAVNILRNKGFSKTKIAITEWRHSASPDTLDQEFRSASLYSRYLMFMIRYPNIDFSCVHAFPFYGGLAEWSNGTTWTSYAGKESRKDTVGKPRWRILPFGLSQRMIMDATRGNQLLDYVERPGKLSFYLFSKPSGGYSLVLINEGAKSIYEEITINSLKPISRYSGKELVSTDPLALPRDSEPQPWQVISINSSGENKMGLNSDVRMSNGLLKINVNPLAVITLDLN